MAIAAVLGVLLIVGCDNPSAMNESSPNVKHVTEGEFTNEVVRCAQPVAVDFYATWCVPCKQLAPILERLAGGYAGKVKFVKVNVDESPGLALAYQAEVLPMVLMFKDGKVANRLMGLPEEVDLKSNLDALITAK